jgi:transposase
VIDVEQWAEIRRLHFAEGMGIESIARQLGLARNTVRDAVRSTTPPKYERAPAGSAVAAVELQIRALLQKTPAMPATVIAERIGWTRGITILRDRVAELRPLFMQPEGTGRTTYEPGELAPWDLWWPEVDIPVGCEQTARLPVIVGTPGYSRWILARMIPSKQTHDVLVADAAWPPLPLAPFRNHRWHVTLYVEPRGLTAGPMPVMNDRTG